MLIQLGCQDQKLPSLNRRSAVLSPKTSTTLPTAIPVQGIAQVLAKRAGPDPTLAPWIKKLKVAFPGWNDQSTKDVPNSDVKRYASYAQRLHRSKKDGKTDFEDIVKEAELEAAGPEVARGGKLAGRPRNPKIAPLLDQLDDIFEKRKDPDQQRDKNGDFKR